MKASLVFVSILAISLIASSSLAAPEKTLQDNKLASQEILNINAWTIYTTNFGPFVNPQTGPGGFWRNPSHGYIFGAGLWVGAIIDSGDTAVAVGYNPNNGSYEFYPYPWDPYWEGPGIYLSTDSTDLADWPLVENGVNIILSEQDSYCGYSDYNRLFTFGEDSILNVVVEQFSYAWSYATNTDIVFFCFKIKNISDKTLNKVYLGPCVDCDIGDESYDLVPANDLTSFDYGRNLAIQYQIDPEPGWDTTGAVGFRLLKSPINNTGDFIQIIDNQYSHKIAPGYALGLTAFKVFTTEQDPINDEERYLELLGINPMNLIADAYDQWDGDTPGDKRFLMSSGPFKLEPNSTVDICFAVMAATDTIKLKALSDTAQKYFNDNMLSVFPYNDNPSVTLHQLLPNAPNPFGHSGTTISYQIGGNGSTPVSLKIYNITGQLVKTLVNDNKTPGYYNATWNGKSENGQKVSAGIYIYRLQARDKSLTKKMVLVK